MSDHIPPETDIIQQALSVNVTASMEVFQQTAKNEPPKPVTVTLRINPFEPWPHSMRVALLHLADDNAMFAGYDTFQEFKRQTETLRPIEQMAADWASQYDKDADPWKILKYALASPKSVVDEPPVSICPRCGKPLWGSPVDLDKASLLDLYRKRPAPAYCLKCGQRFKYDDGDRLSYTANANAEYWKKRLAHEADNTMQPSLATA